MVTKIIPAREKLCYCHQCKYEVLCEAWDIPEDMEGPIKFVPQEDEPSLCYCHQCKYEVLCAPWDLPEDMEGPIKFVPLDEDSD